MSLFPTPLWRAELPADLRDRIEHAVVGALDLMTTALHDLPQGRSWQSHGALHEAPAFAELTWAIRRMSTAMLDFLRIDHEGFEITGCWANVNAPRAVHPIHRHPNNFLSGVYYVRVADGADTIQFHDPRPQVGIIRPPVRELSAANTDMVVAKVQAGTLLLFPSWLEHSVPPNESRIARVSISFNEMFVRYAETMAAPAWEGGYR